MGFAGAEAINRLLDLSVKKDGAGKALRITSEKIAIVEGKK